MTKYNAFIGFYYFYFIFVISSGMFESPYREILLYSSALYLAPIVLLNQQKKSLFLLVLLILSLIVFFCVAINYYSSSFYIEIENFREENNIFGADTIFIASLKMIIKLSLLFIVFPINEKYFSTISKLIKIFIYFTLIQLLLTTFLYNFMDININIIRSFTPILSNLKPELEEYPFVFLANIIPGIENLKYVRPLSFFGEPTALGTFVLALAVIYTLINKKLDIKFLIATLLIFIIAITKFALVVAGISIIIYFISRLIKNRLLVSIISLILIFLWWRILVNIGTGYMQVRTTDTVLLLNHLTLLPNGFNSASWFMNITYAKMAHLGAISILFDLGIILSFFVYFFILKIFLNIFKIKNRHEFIIFFVLFIYFIFSFLLNNVYYSGIFLLTIYLYYINMKKLQMKH